ncbi:hypothetical protein AWZ03_007336 [Drosophila navojoa]|uniref:Uncharacterized protein n=1 Tax=Drosophila navojoa TaxID=7232 RepID=A0A484BE38_DRONA|nr:hypothetical protein AWZ03_007336 [Drosophila navojoa]
MDLPNEHILDVFLPQTAGDAAVPEHLNEPRNRIGTLELNILQRMALTRELQQHSAMLGAGDGLHNNRIRWDENLPPFIVVRSSPGSKFWHYMPVLILMSSWLFKLTLNMIGVDTQTAGVLGVSYNVHFNILQWLILFASYWYKGFSA